MARSSQRHLAERRAALAGLIGPFCARHHDAPEGELCDECAELLAYAGKRAERCPHDPKPRCKACATHCYAPGYVERIRAVMREARTRHPGSAARQLETGT